MYLSQVVQEESAKHSYSFCKSWSKYHFEWSRRDSKEKISEIEAFGVKCVGVSGDISDYEKAGTNDQEAEAQLGSIHILINNAGITNDKLVMRMIGRRFQKMFRY